LGRGDHWTRLRWRGFERRDVDVQVLALGQRDVARDEARREPDLDLSAPAAGTAPSSRTYTRSAGSMKVVVELRDAASGVLIGRIIDYEKTREFQDPQPANQGTNLEEFRLGFANAARYPREAIHVAKAERPPP
jgi:hypothetical protein